MQRIAHWTPRVLAIGFALFLAIFALDVFGEFNTIWETAVALFMHLIPTFLLLIATGIAWRMPVIGGGLFVLLGVLSIVQFNTLEHPISFFIVSVPAFIVGILFLWDAWVERDIPQQRSHA